MPDLVDHGVELLIKSLESCGASLLILGFLIATWKWVQRIIQEGEKSALRHAVRCEDECRRENDDGSGKTRHSGHVAR